MNTPPVEIRNLWVEYPSAGRGVPPKTAVAELNLKIQPGEVFGLLRTERRGQDDHDDECATRLHNCHRG